MRNCIKGGSTRKAESHCSTQPQEKDLFHIQAQLQWTRRQYQTNSKRRTFFQVVQKTKTENIQTQEDWRDSPVTAQQLNGLIQIHTPVLCPRDTAQSHLPTFRLSDSLPSSWPNDLTPQNKTVIRMVFLWLAGFEHCVRQAGLGAWSNSQALRLPLEVGVYRT